MADNQPPAIDQGALNFARGVGAQNNAATPFEVNGAKGLEGLWEEGANKIAGTAAKLLEMFPFLSFLSKLIPTNAGQVGVTTSYDTQGFFAKPALQFTGMKGGVGANILFGEVLKNKNIVDQTGGISGNPVDMSNLVSPANYPTYNFASASMSDLGTFSHNAPGGDMGMGRSV